MEDVAAALWNTVAKMDDGVVHVSRCGTNDLDMVVRLDGGRWVGEAVANYVVGGQAEQGGSIVLPCQLHEARERADRVWMIGSNACSRVQDVAGPVFSVNFRGNPILGQVGPFLGNNVNVDVEQVAKRRGG